MSLSLTAVLEAAAGVGPDAVYLRTAAGEVTFVDLDRLTRSSASSLLSSGISPGSAIRVPWGDVAGWVVQVFGATRIGVVAQLSPRPAGAPARLEAPATVVPGLDPGAAEDAVWSQTPAVVNSAGRGYTHGELVTIGLDGQLPATRPLEPDALLLAAVIALVQRRELP